MPHTPHTSAFDSTYAIVKDGYNFIWNRWRRAIRRWEDMPEVVSFDGGGPRVARHRCPGEWITMHSIALALHFLTRGMTYEVLPGQDLPFDLSQMPTHPESGFIIRNVRATPVLDAGTPRLPSWFAASDASAAERRGEVGAQMLQA